MIRKISETTIYLLLKTKLCNVLRYFKNKLSETENIHLKLLETDFAKDELFIYFKYVKYSKSRDLKAFS